MPVSHSQNACHIKSKVFKSGVDFSQKERPELAKDKVCASQCLETSGNVGQPDGIPQLDHSFTNSFSLILAFRTTLNLYEFMKFGVGLSPISESLRTCLSVFCIALGCLSPCYLRSMSNPKPTKSLHFSPSLCAFQGVQKHVMGDIKMKSQC